MKFPQHDKGYLQKTAATIILFIKENIFFKRSGIKLLLNRKCRLSKILFEEVFDRVIGLKKWEID